MLWVNMKRVLFIMLCMVGFLYIGCASFSPGSVNIASAVSTPGSVSKDSIYIFVKEFSSKETKRIFDCDLLIYGFCPLGIGISNRSNYPIEFIPHSIRNYIDVEEVLSETEFDPNGRLIVWSIPWVINMLAGFPFYYGIAWPIFGLIDFNKAHDANDDRTEFFHNLVFKPIILQPGQDVQGVVFLAKGFIRPLQIILVKENKQITFEVFSIK